MTDTREEITEAMRDAIAGKLPEGAYVRTTNEQLDEMAIAALEASPLERYRAALEEMRDRIDDGKGSWWLLDIAERALREVGDGR